MISRVFPLSPSVRSSRTNRSTLSGTLTRAKMLGAILGGLHRDGQIQAQPADEREGVGRIDGQRGQNGENLIIEVLRQRGAIGVGQVAPPDEFDAVADQRRAYRLHEHLGRAGWPIAVCVHRSGATARVV